jgi:hypothetical protein
MYRRNRGSVNFSSVVIAADLVGAINIVKKRGVAQFALLRRAAATLSRHARAETVCTSLASLWPLTENDAAHIDWSTRLVANRALCK